MTQAAPKAESSAAQAASASRAASRRLARVPLATRNEILAAVATRIEANTAQILSANETDCATATDLAKAGRMPAAMVSRLRVNEQSISDMVQRLRQVAGLPDPLGRRLAATELDDGLVLYKETCPLGVIAVIFEARPDAIPQVASLALKSGNAILLKGGSEAAHTNEILVALWKECLRDFPAVPDESIQLLHSRADVRDLLQLRKDIDLLIPRGGRDFVEYISRNSLIPVLGHGEGICHVYVDRSANLEKALAISLDAKVQYPAACNAVETLLVHRDIAAKFLPPVVANLQGHGVEIRGCPRVLAALPKSKIIAANEADWSTEYSDLILSVKIVDDLDEALAHIQKYGSSHTEAIVTENAEAAKRFLDEVDAAGVYHNASTRFGDGYRYGLGSEIGISTSKLHARGPMGLEGLTTYKYKLVGDGHIVASYSRGEKVFRHRLIPESER
jgi:glutamate-5-semialdehyde dehydrogenase